MTAYHGGRARRRVELALTLLIVVGSSLAANAMIFSFGWGNPWVEYPSLLRPPGWLIGAVWVGLFTLMAVARWIVVAAPGMRPADIRLVDALIVVCLSYVFYALATDSRVLGLLGNIGTIALALVATVRLWRVARPAALLIVPVPIWIAYATATILAG
jgi:tryptophan-rich sensory protein